MLTELLACVVLLAGIASRLEAGRYARRAGEGSDELFHRIYVDILRNGGHRFPTKLPQFVGPGRLSYPGGYHWALSFLPERASNAVGRYGALIGDLALGGSVSVLLATDEGVPTPAVIALLGLYVASPALTLVNLGPRSFHLTPRLPSQLLFGAIVVCAIAAGGDVSLPLAAVITALLAVNLLVSKFALQATLFALPVLVIAGDPTVVLGCFAAACLLATVVSRGFFLQQVRGQMEHLEWYAKRHAPTLVRAMAWKRLLAAMRSRDLSTAGRMIALENPVTVGLMRHYHLVAAAAWLLVVTPDLDPPAKAALAFTLAGVLGWAATSVGPLRILGEAERYLEFVFPGSWFLFWTLPHGTGLVIAIILAGIYEGLLHIANLAALRRILSARARTSAEADRDEVLGKLAERSSATVLFLDVKDTYAVHRVHDGIRAVMFSGHMSLRGELSGFLDWFLSSFPLVHPRHLDEIVERYDVDMIVAKRAVIDTENPRDDGGYDLASFELLFENRNYALFSVPSSAGPRGSDRDAIMAGSSCTS